jgi:FkbH-like protein
MDKAALQLRRALSPPLRYSVLPRLGKLIATVAANDPSSVRRCRLAVLGTSTVALLLPVLRALCFRDRIQVETYEGLYGAVEHEILSSESGLARFRPDVVVLLGNWRDLRLPALSPEPEATVSHIVDARANLWKRLAEAFNCHVIDQASDFPAAEPLDYVANAERGGRSEMIQAINRGLYEAAPAHVSILDTPSIQREAGSARWEDDMAWFNFRQHPATETLPALAEGIAAHLRAVLGLTRKVLVTDLDNTLWKGIIGEDGLDGIQIGPGSPAGEAHRRLQEYMLDLKSRGILLAVSSKNNPDDARLPFERHPQMALRLEDFAAFEANWNDKAQNIREIARRLSLGLDSFVFLDDNPLEREWVRSQVPDVTIADLGSSVFHYVRDLERGRYFFSLTLTAEDLARSEQYRVEAQRETLRSSTASMEEFLADLQLEAAALPISDANLARVTQLVNKTNQFNATTRRYTEAQVRALAENPAGWAAAFQMSDRFGSYGLIGVILCTPGPSAAEWEIDTCLMSCRALGRQMERFMFDRLIEAAIGRGVRGITGVYRPTQKNALVSELFEQMGFRKISDSPEEKRYTLKVPSEPVNAAVHVRNVSQSISNAQLQEAARP